MSNANVQPALLERAETAAYAAVRLVDHLEVRPHAVSLIVSPDVDLYATEIGMRAGETGVVYTLDVSEDSLPHLMHKAPPNLVRVDWVDRAQLPLSDHSVDLVLLAFALRQPAQFRRTLSEAWRVLRPAGRIAVADWIRQEERRGPSRESRLAAATCEQWLATLGFGLIGQRTLNSSHYLIIGRRPMTN